MTTMALDVAPFIAAALNSDIIDALRSVPRAAQCRRFAQRTSAEGHTRGVRAGAW